MNMLLFLTFIVRLCIGLIAAAAAAVAAYLGAWFAILPPTTPVHILTPSLVTVIGLGTGLGGSIAWVIPESGRFRIVLGAAAAMVAGIGGAWVAFLIGSPEPSAQLIDIQTREELTRGNPATELITAAGIRAAMLGGTAAANLAAAVNYLAHAGRHREY